MDEIGIIYMITEKHERTVKVGFAKTLSQRQRQYRTHCTCTVYIETIEGTKAQEKAYQEKLREMGYIPLSKNPRYEWFKLPKGMKKEELMKAGFKIFG